MFNKYRVFDNKLNRYLTSEELQDLVLTYNGNLHHVNQHRMLSHLYKDDRMVIEWCLNKKYKNGEYMYEGDIVKTYINFGMAGDIRANIRLKMTPLGMNLQEWVLNEDFAYPIKIGNANINIEKIEWCE